jgi:hypothetical protein
MLDPTRPLALPDSASTFFASARQRGTAFGVWAEVGRAIGWPHCVPAPLNQTVREAVMLALVVAAAAVKPCLAGALQ